MAWEDFETQAPATPPAPTASHVRRPDGLRRAILTAGIAGALLVTGGVAVVFAASPDPSAGAPATTAPSNGGSTAPNGGTTAPSQSRQGHGGQPCPDGGNGSSGSGGSGSQSGQPAPDTTAPAT
jgi:hypothetical protein